MTAAPAREERHAVWREVERKAVAWLAERRTLFDPGNAEEPGVLFARKALVEVALLVGLRARLDPTPFDPTYQTLFNQVADVAGRASYRELMTRDPNALLLYAGTYAAMRLCGRDDPEFRHVIEQVVGGGYAACLERVPYRYLDLLHTLELAGVRHALPPVEAVLPFTTLCTDPSVLGLADRDIYAITHAVFYATDFGLRVPRWPSTFDFSRTVQLLDALLLLSRRRGNADLVAELLCSLRCLGVQNSAEADRAWAYLADLQEPDGRVSGPEGIVHPALGADDPGYRTWATGYHTTIVVALAALLDRSPVVVRTEPVPPSPVSGDRIDAALRRAVAWLSGTTGAATLAAAIPAMAAAARGARSVGDPALVRPALVSLLDRLEAEPEHPWLRYGSDVVFELAHGIENTGLACSSLDRFLADMAAALDGVDNVPLNVVAGISQLSRLGCLAPERAADLIAPAGLVEPPAEGQPTARTAAELVQRTGDDPGRLNGDAAGWHAVGERLAADLPDACRDYDLSKVAGIVRALVLLGWSDHRVTRDAVDFLLSQQDRHGAFGFPVTDDPDDRSRMQCVWTRSCVVALAAVRLCRPRR